MKKFFFSAFVLLFIGSLCFPQGVSPAGMKEWIIPSWEHSDYKRLGPLTNTSSLAQGIRDIEKAGALQKTGTFLTYGGGLLAVMGATFLIGAKDFGGACCGKNYRTAGYIFLGAGAAMVVSGYFLIKKGKRLEGGLSFQLNPFEMKTSLGYRLAF